MASKTRKTPPAEPDDGTVDLAQFIAAANAAVPKTEPKAPPPGPLPAGPTIVGSVEAATIALSSAYQGGGIVAAAGVAGAATAAAGAVAVHKIRSHRKGRGSWGAGLKAAGRRTDSHSGAGKGSSSGSGNLGLGLGGGKRGGGGSGSGTGGRKNGGGGRGTLGGLLPGKGGTGGGGKIPKPRKHKGGTGSGSAGTDNKNGKGSLFGAGGSSHQSPTDMKKTKTLKPPKDPKSSKGTGGGKLGRLGKILRRKRGKSDDPTAEDPKKNKNKDTKDTEAQDPENPGKDEKGRKGPKDGVPSPKKNSDSEQTVKHARLRRIKDKLANTKIGRGLSKLANTRFGKWTRRHFARLAKWGTSTVGRRALRVLHIGAVGLLALSTAGLVTVPALLAGILTLVPSALSKEHAREHGWNVHPLTWPKTVYVRVYESAGRYTHLSLDPDNVPVADADDPGDSGITPDTTTAGAGPEPASTGRLGDLLTTNYGNRSYFARSAATTAAAYMKYEPPAMLAVAAEYGGLPQGIRHAATAIRQLANLAGSYPTTGRVVATIHAIANLVDQAARTADDIEPHFRKVHALDLAKYEAPRPGEEMWNILKRRLDGTMPKSRFETAAQETATVYRRYSPEHMIKDGLVTAAAEFDGIGQGIASLSTAIKHMHRRSDERYPVDKSVVGLIAAVVQKLARAQAAARELSIAFRKDNAHDIGRHEKPRNGKLAEAMWDA